VPVSDSADYVLCDGDSEESSLSEVAARRSRQSFDVCRTGQNSVAHDSASPLESSVCLLLLVGFFCFLFFFCGSVN